MTETAMTLFEKLRMNVKQTREPMAAFDATPAGSALKAYRDALQVVVLMGDADPRLDEAWKAVRCAERDLIKAIKALQARP